MDFVESDATYCSEIEKENSSQLRRSKRLSQKLDQCFRLNEDPVCQRFEEIHRMLESDIGCKDYSKEDWCALKTEVNSLRKSLKSVPKPKLTFVIKKINQKLRILKIETSLEDFLKLTNESTNQFDERILRESVGSPNVLAGMLTELNTEIPPYQPDHSSKNTEMTSRTNLNTEPIECTQVNPLDLTKKLFEMPGNDCVQARQPRKGNLTEKRENADLLRCPIIDLTEISQKNDIAYRNESKRSNKKDSKRTPTVAYTSKWLKYLPTQQRPQEICEKSNISLPPQDRPKPFKQSLIKLYKDISIGAKTSVHTSKKSDTKHSPSKVKSGKKSNHKHNLKRHLNPQYLRNTESVFRRDYEFDSVQVRNVQTENFTDLAQDSPPGDCAQDRLTFSDDESSVSLPFSLKKSFKKVFGTDSLTDVLGCEKIVYSLTERHVEQLAKALSIQKDSLKTKIEQILLDDDRIQINDDAQSEATVLECSQSPTPRLFPSQRSQN